MQDCRKNNTNATFITKCLLIGVSLLFEHSYIKIFRLSMNKWIYFYWQLLFIGTSRERCAYYHTKRSQVLISASVLLLALSDIGLKMIYPVLYYNVHHIIVLYILGRGQLKNNIILDLNKKPKKKTRKNKKYKH